MKMLTINSNRIDASCSASGLARLSCRLIPLLVLSVVVLPAVQAQAASTEAKVKTAYVYNFLRRTTWPAETFADDATPYSVLILGEDSFEGLLDTVASKKKVNKRSIELKRIASIDEYKPCHLLYVSGALDADQKKALVDLTAGKPVLLIGETDGFALDGAIANFKANADGTISYELNLEAAGASNIAFEDQIKEVGEAVK